MTEKTKPQINRADVLRMAEEAGAGRFRRDESAQIVTPEVLERFTALARAFRPARIAAQAENEILKDQLAASFVAERRAVREAVLAEREACAALMADLRAKSRNHLFRSALTVAEGEIRARGAA